MGIIITIIKVIFLLGFLILIHEGGHFLVAKLCKIKVNEFAIGFGPTIWKKQGKETKYALRLIPLGGFVSMEGEETPSSEKGSFSEAKIWKRIAIVCAGGLVNIIFGLLVYFIIVVINGVFYNNIVDYTIENYGAESAGIMAGDQIIEINGQKIESKETITLVLNTSKSDMADVKILRNGEIIELQVKLTEDNSRYYLGIVFEKMEPAFSERLYYGAVETKDFIIALGDNIKMLFTGKIGVDHMVGPVGISSEVAKTDTLLEFFYLLAIISLSLGVTNLLPLPPLDGGKIVLIAIEGITRKKISEKVQINIQLFGMALLLALSIFVTFNDITRLGN